VCSSDLPVTISFPTRLTRSLRVRVVSLGPGDGGRRTGAGIADIKIPGMNPAEIIQVPSDLVATAERTPGGSAGLSQAPLTYLFERARTGIPGRPDEETGISRRFEVPIQRSFDLTGTVRLNRSASDIGIDGIVDGATDVHVSGSTRFLGNPLLRGSAALDGDAQSSWVPAGDVGQSLTVTFPRRTISRMSVHTDVRAGRARIEQLTFRFSDGSVVLANVRRPDGVVRRRFPARHVTSVAISITRVAAPSDPRKPVGISEVVIPGVKPLARAPGAPLPCTSGSTYVLDGRPIQVRPIGSASSLLSGAPLRIEACSRKPVTLRAGWHNLVARGALQSDVVEFASGARTDTGQGSAGPSTGFTQTSDGGYEVDVMGATRPFYLVIGQNFTPRWHARIGSDDLGPPILLDGYSTGWRVTKRGDYTISVVYGPQRVYRVVLLVTAASVVAVIVVIGASLLRRRREDRP